MTHDLCSNSKVKVLIALSLAALLLGACSSSGGGSEGSENITDIAALPVNVSSADSCSALIDNPTVGFTCIHCSQPQAHAQARVMADVLLRSCLRNIATNYLVDDTFVFSEAFLFEQMDTLTQGNRNVNITFFMANGAAQRSFATTIIEGFGTKTSPADFRELIQNDSSFREEYRELLRRIRPVVLRAQSRGATVSIIPVLEDNLTIDAFEAMMEMTLDVLDSSVVIGRNPCRSARYPLSVEPCEDSSDLIIPDGVFSEAHSVGPLVRTIGGIVTNDGIEYESDVTGPVDSAQTTLVDVQNFRREVHRSGNTFLLWSGRRQGLLGNFQALPFVAPEDREYPVPSEEEQDELMRFLLDEDL